MRYIQRHLERVLSSSRHGKGVVALTGARQTGKSTLLEHYLGATHKITFDDVRQRNSAVSDPALFINENPTPLFLDEVQYAPDIFPYIKMEVDKQKRKNLYFLSGSQKFNMIKNVTESLAGRIAIFELLGLSLRELQGLDFTAPFIPTKDYVAARTPVAQRYDIWHHIHRGSYPELQADSSLDWNVFYSSYIKTYIERDVHQLAQVGDELKFYRFMEVLAARISCLLNVNEICQEVGVSHSTAERWISVLRTSNIIYLLRPYSNNLTKRAIKSPKLYFLDTGLAAYLSHWETEVVLKAGAKAGDFFENYLIAEVLKSYYNAGLEPHNLFFYRDKEKREIDLVIERDGVLYPVEIKKKSNPDSRDCENFKLLSGFAKTGDGAVLCSCDAPVPLATGLRALPVWYV
jgi:predicted AAA+ superfamily ATPase